MSMVLEYGQTIWNPKRLDAQKVLQSPPYTPKAWRDFVKLTLAVKELEGKTNPPSSSEDTEKLKWFEDMQKRMAQIEKKLDKLAKNIQQV